jgi:hypothetical protein
MNIARERVQVWHIQEEIKKHIQETFWFEDAIRYAAQLHFEAEQHELHTIPSRPQQKVPEHACYAYLRPKQLQY